LCQLINETFAPLELLFSLTITWVTDDQPENLTVTETSSPAAIEALGNFLDQPGGHDLIFCFPEGQHLYADRYILQRASGYFRNLLTAGERERGGKFGASQGKPPALADDSDDEDLEEDIRPQPIIPSTSTTAPSSTSGEIVNDLDDGDVTPDGRVKRPRANRTSSDATVVGRMSPDLFKSESPFVGSPRPIPSRLRSGTVSSIKDDLTQDARFHDVRNRQKPPIFEVFLTVFYQQKGEAPPYNEAIAVMWINEVSSPYHETFTSANI